MIKWILAYIVANSDNMVGWTLPQNIGSNSYNPFYSYGGTEYALEGFSFMVNSKVTTSPNHMMMTVRMDHRCILKT